jgi:hypothetical protein
VTTVDSEDKLTLVPDVVEADTPVDSSCKEILIRMKEQVSHLHPLFILDHLGLLAMAFRELPELDSAVC